MLDIIKRHIIDIIGIAPAVSLFFFEGLAAFWGMIILLSYAYLRFALNFGKIIIPN